MLQRITNYLAITSRCETALSKGGSQVIQYFSTPSLRNTKESFASFNIFKCFSGGGRPSVSTIALLHARHLPKCVCVCAHTHTTSGLSKIPTDKMFPSACCFKLPFFGGGGGGEKWFLYKIGGCRNEVTKLSIIHGS